MNTYLYIQGTEVIIIESIRDLEFVKKIKNRDDIILLPENKTIKDLIEEEILETPENNKFDEETNSFILMTDEEKYNAGLLTIEDIMNNVRAERNRLLSESDFIVMPDSNASDNCKASFIIYRQELRDLLNAEGFSPLDISWPIKPEYIKK